MTAQHIISLWPSRRAIAADCGVGVEAVHSWHRRNVIPPVHLFSLEYAARRRGFDVTLDDLRAASRQPVKTEAADA